MKAVIYKIAIFIVSVLIIIGACKKDEDNDSRLEFISAQGPEPGDFSNENPWISWTFNASGGSTVTYDLYIGETNEPDSLVADNVTENTYQLRGLSYSTTYFYKIVANTGGMAVESPVMSFTTRNMPDFMDAFTGKYSGKLIKRTSIEDGLFEDTTYYNRKTTVTRININTLLIDIEDLRKLDGIYVEDSVPNLFQNQDSSHFYFFKRDSIYCFIHTDSQISYHYYGRQVSH